MFKSGFISIVGRTNVGKSTLFNKLLKEDLSIISPRPQTTRVNVRGILNVSDAQMVFIDTPGLHKPKDLLGRLMIKKVQSAINETDLIQVIVEPDYPEDEEISLFDQLKGIKPKVFLLINKVDKVKKDLILSLIDEYRKIYNFSEIIPISALKGDNLDILLEKTKEYLPEGEPFFPADISSDQIERFFVAELIRRETYFLYRDEIPYSIGVQTEEMKEREGNKKIYIRAVIFVERDSQKGIIIGKSGEMIKKLGEISRTKIEKFLDKGVYLELWVKVEKNWRRNEEFLKKIGYGGE